MPVADKRYFECLKKDISRKLRETHPGIEQDVSKWKGDDIVKFQDDLIHKANGRISEKWFYTHIKAPNGHLPRIDILNLLSRYVGHDDWNSYKGSRVDVVPEEHKGKSLNIWLLMVFSFLAIIAVFIYLTVPFGSRSYSFCFINAVTREPLKAGELEVIVLNDAESPYRISINEKGCVDFTMRQGSVKFAVKGPYYKSDTIVRRFNKGRSNESILVRVNDYALMLHLFSKGDIRDWDKHRAQLNKMFADDAEIFQIMEDRMVGMEMYNKKEFIDKLTMPLTSLKNIEIIETVFEGNKIKELRFKQIK